MADIPEQSPGPDGLHGLFHRANGNFSSSVCVGVLSHAGRRIVHFAVTDHPMKERTLQQLREAFPWNESPQYLLRDRDAIYGEHLVAVIQGMGIEEVRTVARSLWQNPCVGGASGLNSARMHGSPHCVEPEVVTPDSAKLFCFLDSPFDLCFVITLGRR